ncbi:ABC-2 family transporter protein [Clostridium tepidiprofundi DSM 19306]|uniref:ABC-2 family transporter protein n=1 Tax=Clostridium tepidiprofundi DSM 19306 TaxID=1121338 RepID=A0A151AWQ9_9CLOT|nr:ABC transporter permease [Clostridium tepidiprofundi]KYH32068.1 ABC-2 family transporter protein [Clostridium tepidiprofundi DSM 19306]
MLDGLYSEFLKLKKTGYYVCILLVCLICLLFSTMNRKFISSLNWYGYFFNFEIIAFIIFYTLVIPIIISFIFIREFRYKTDIVAFSYPNGRFGAFINKFLMSVLVVAIIYAISYVFIVLSGFLFVKHPLTSALLLNHCKVFLVSFIFQIALIPLTILIALIGKSMTVSAIYSIVLVISNLKYMLGSKYNNFIFSILPAAPVAKIKVPVYKISIPLNMVISKSDISLGIFVFIVSITGCILFYRKADIH